MDGSGLAKRIVTCGVGPVPPRRGGPSCAPSRGQAAVADEATDDRTILLLDERLIVLLVRARACDFELLFARPWHDRIVVVVEVHPAQEPRRARRKRLCARLIASTTREPSRVTNGRHSVQPVATSTVVRDWMNESATDAPP